MTAPDLYHCQSCGAAQAATRAFSVSTRYHCENCDDLFLYDPTGPALPVPAVRASDDSEPTPVPPVIKLDGIPPILLDALAGHFTRMQTQLDELIRAWQPVVDAYVEQLTEATRTITEFAQWLETVTQAPADRPAWKSPYGPARTKNDARGATKKWRRW